MVQLLYTSTGDLLLPDPEYIYVPGDEKATREVREHMRRVREEMIAEHERRQRLRGEASTGREEGT